MRARRAMTIGCVALTAAVLASAGACVSERTSVTGVDASACNVALPSQGFGSAVVIIRDFAFTPRQVRIRPGTKVTWVNCGAAGADSHTTTADAGKWASQILAPGDTYTAEFATAGTFTYHCEPHPGMKGGVIVE